METTCPNLGSPALLLHMRYCRFLKDTCELRAVKMAIPFFSSHQNSWDLYGFRWDLDGYMINMDKVTPNMAHIIYVIFVARWAPEG